MAAWRWDDDDYFARGPPSPPRHFPPAGRRSGNLAPEHHHHEGGLHRSASTGQGPRPEVINIYNYQDQLNDQQQRSAPGGWMAPPPAPPAQVVLPEWEQRGRSPNIKNEIHLGDGFADELAALRLGRSRSRGRSDVGFHEGGHGLDFYKWHYEQKQRELRDIEQRNLLEREQTRLKMEFDLRAAKEEARRRAQREQEERREREMIEHYEKKKMDAERKQREAEIALKLKIEREEREAKEKREREYKEFERQQKERKEEDERKRKAKQEEIDRAMRDRLLAQGYSLAQVEQMIHPRKSVEKIPAVRAVSTTTDLVVRDHLAHVPVFPKIHRKFLEIDTLMYYQIPYEIDRANPDYIILRREMSTAETDILFRHTEQLRKRGTLLIEDNKHKGKKQYAWIRSRSRSAKPKRDIRVLET